MLAVLGDASGIHWQPLADRLAERGISIYWNSRSRRPYISIPLPGGFRIGHRL